jgi:hypothetical protein
MLINQNILLINGLEVCGKLLDEGELERATSYMSIILLPLVVNAKPYCIGIYSVGKGHDANQLQDVHNMIQIGGRRTGVRVISNPGDGDSVLRSTQWTIFTCKRNISWLTEMYIPLDVFFSSNGSTPAIGMQDLPHNIKKLRNQLTMTETRCLVLGLDIDRESELTMRWDYVFQLFGKYPEVMKDSSLSGLLVSDRSDPSLVADIACLYRLFLHEGYNALGMYLKAIQFLTESFYDKDLTPEEKVYRAWWSKTFFVVWYEKVPSRELFISMKTFQDVICCCDGLILYMVMLRRYFPDADVLPHLFTSDQCEQAFAFVRIGRYSGRRTNIDCITLAEGLACRNKTYELSVRVEDVTQCAHTRGRRILRKPVPKPGETAMLVEKRDQQPHKGSSLNEQTLKNAMKKGTKECIAECRALNLDFFVDTAFEDAVETPMSNNAIKDVMFNEPVNVHEEDDDYEPEYDGSDADDDPGNEGEECSTSSPYINTTMGRMHIKTAERMFLNGGGLHNVAQSRGTRNSTKKYRFDKNSYTNFLVSSECCKDAIKKGKKVRLPTYRDRKKHVKGMARFVSRNLTPTKFACRHHYPDATVWIWSGGSYVRCTL